MRSMCVTGVPVEFYKQFGLYVKHEEKCCPGGPHFSKCRGVFAHIAARSAKTIGVLDTSHSQGGWAVARACKMLKRKCVVFYPVRKADAMAIVPPQQLAAERLGAELVRLPAGRSAILYHGARKRLREIVGEDSYLMPNALKLPETVTETAAEFERTKLPKGLDTILVSASSATIAAGVYLGVLRVGWSGRIIVHLGYSRPISAVRQYMQKCVISPQMVTWSDADFTDMVEVVDEHYVYSDEAKPGPSTPFPCNKYYDLKAFRWWLASGGRGEHGKTLFWNVG